MKKNKPEKPKRNIPVIIGSDEKVCYNCGYLMWCIGIGQGLICACPKNEPNDGSIHRIHSRRHTCKNFVPKCKERFLK